MMRAPAAARRVVCAWLLACTMPLAQPVALAQTAAAPMHVVDDAGAPVDLPRPAARIVSLAPHLTELLFAAGAGTRVVGTVAYSDYPAAARQIERVGDSAMLDFERIVALKPDLIVLWQDGMSPQQIARVSHLGIAVFASRTRTLDDIAQTLRKLGTLAGTGAAAQARAHAYEKQLSDLRQRYAGRRELSVFYQIWRKPLMTVNAGHPISQALALCGAHNVFAEMKLLTPTVAEEAVMQFDPDVVVTGSIDPQGANDLGLWSRMSTLRATRAAHLVVVNPDTLHRQSDRILDGIGELCTKLDAARNDGQAKAP